ncbi:MAG: HAMP domain-containing sensor histidine kinase, partial [Pseudomonadota bacterium]
ERALIERTEALEAADRLKNDFVSHMSYELRTPLTNIIGFSELLSSDRIGPLNEKQREYLSDIHVSSNTLQTIINDILDLATIDAGAFALSLQPVSIADIIESAVSGIHEKLQRAGIRLHIEVEPGIEDVLADANRMKQVLYNLLSNAIGFSQEGAHVRLTCHRDGGMVVFAVSDDGVGIPAEMHETVFERFESNAQGTRHRGAGLGLAIVRSLVELHGGKIALASQPGVGTTVTVRIPASAAARGHVPGVPTEFLRDASSQTDAA